MSGKVEVHISVGTTIGKESLREIVKFIEALQKECNCHCTLDVVIYP
jgi:hypothetical protein|nr:MAG TPA: hypothetical protein [Caudoviricetes sp.]